MMNSRITIDDVAQALGVSKTTVSRAISGKGRVGKETKERILQYIEQNNYKPSVMAQGLARSKTFNIGVILPGDFEAVDLPFFKKCMVGMSETVSIKGYDILVSMIMGNDISGLKRIVDNRKVDGVILTRTLVKDRPAEYLKKSGIPFVTIGTCDDPEIVQVDNDNLEACKEMTSILIGKGMRRMALLGGSSNHVITKTRLQGFREGYEQNGMKAEESLIYLDVDNDLKLASVIGEVIRSGADGLVCMDDALAGKVIRKCKSEHIHIPKDLKLASFYNSTLLENLSPGVTSLSFDERKLGSAVAGSLIDMIEGRKVEGRKLKNYEVVLKESTK